jgi:hypothetical protein
MQWSDKRIFIVSYMSSCWLAGNIQHCFSRLICISDKGTFFLVGLTVTLLELFFNIVFFLFYEGCVQKALILWVMQLILITVTALIPRSLVPLVQSYLQEINTINLILKQVPRHPSLLKLSKMLQHVAYQQRQQSPNFLQIRRSVKFRD